MTAALENALLGAMLDADSPAMGSNAGALLDITGLRASDIKHDARVKIAWQLVEQLVRRRRPVDGATVFSAGAGARVFADADLSWLQQLQASNNLSREHFATVAEQLRNTNLRDETLKAVKARIEAIESGADAGSEFAAIEGICAASAHSSMTDGTGADDVFELAADMDRSEDAAPILIPSGIDAVDAIIKGFPPNLAVIVGQPSVGKSALMGTIIDNQLTAGFKVGLFGLEDGTKWLAKRLIARDIGVGVRDLVDTVRGIGIDREVSRAKAELFQERAAHYSQLLKNLTVFRRDSIKSGEMCRRAVHWIVNRGVQIIYIDHLGEVEHERRNPDDEHRLAVARSYRDLRNIGIKYGVPIVALAHTNREAAGKWGEEARAPRLSEIAESREIEGMARLALGLWNVQGELDVMRCTVLKQTEGERDVDLKLKRMVTSALIDPHEGERFSPAAERLAKFKAEREKKEAIAADAKAKRDAAKIAEKARKDADKLKKRRQGDLMPEDA